MQRDQIINNLAQSLKEASKNVEIFTTPTFENSDLPLIIIKDLDDNINSDAFNIVSHSLNVEIHIITTTYKKSSEIIKAVLQILKGFKSKFLTIKQTSLNREEFQIYDNEYILSVIGLNFSYKSEVFEA
ncbi:MAG: hypothetical protein ACTTJC_02125 [Campylobacter sp.]